MCYDMLPDPSLIFLLNSFYIKFYFYLFIFLYLIIPKVFHYRCTKI